jgi:excisionase family DNA binding protein
MVPPAIAAELLDIHRNTLARWVKAGRLTGYKLGPEAQSPVRFRRSDIARLKAALCGEPAPDVDDPVPTPPP